MFKKPDLGKDFLISEALTDSKQAEKIYQKEKKQLDQRSNQNCESVFSLPWYLSPVEIRRSK